MLLANDPHVRPDLWNVRRFAHACGLNVREAFIAAGMDQADFDGIALVKPDISTLSTVDMLDEIRRRVAEAD